MMNKDDYKTQALAGKQLGLPEPKEPRKEGIHVSGCHDEDFPAIAIFLEGDSADPLGFVPLKKEHMVTNAVQRALCFIAGFIHVAGETGAEINTSAKLKVIRAACSHVKEACSSPQEPRHFIGKEVVAGMRMSVKEPDDAEGSDGINGFLYSKVEVYKSEYDLSKGAAMESFKIENKEAGESLNILFGYGGGYDFGISFFGYPEGFSPSKAYEFVYDESGLDDKIRE